VRRALVSCRAIQLQDFVIPLGLMMQHLPTVPKTPRFSLTINLNGFIDL
jgi:hypothetical protein